MTVLRIEDLHTVVRSRGRDLPVVRGVSLDVDAGEIVGLVGESGSGKSFTALSVLGLLPEGARVTSGRILVDGEDLVALRERDRRTRRGSTVAMIYQDPMTALNPLMTVGAQIAEGLRAHGIRGPEAKRRTLAAIEEVGLPKPDRIARSYPHRLSGGQRQRVVIASALALRPRVLIADEPTTALDVTIQQQILALVDELRTEHDLAVLWITHDLGVVARIAARVAVMYAGRVAEQAGTRELFAAPQHPYSAALLASIPSPTDTERGPLPQIGGAPPDLAALPAGCPFEPRCAYREDRCATGEPEPVHRGGSDTACFVPRERWGVRGDAMEEPA
ncbi:ABC transporter ATP-binding protein [Actinocatenispora rupis]|uniref:ABC transporter ATP-binding protein n=1 Tax=Actinocatenispora rupis TaxID=519421 RepID=A0A8J3JDL2_9ACTN|nr:ABC transporter ATP-binding protein [Actinocatenispora rupis]GID12843.1 ABC transporter ATP-binding protein [Actinocatenispora rupis]